jgi:hypothetical protein
LRACGTAHAALNNLLAAGIVSLVNERQWGRVFQAAKACDGAPTTPTSQQLFSVRQGLDQAN